MKTAELMKKSGVSRNTLRFYEEINLIQKPTRVLSSGYRSYSAETLKELIFIKQAKQAGLTLIEIKELLDLDRSKKITCELVSKKVGSKIEEIENQIFILEEKRNFLMNFKNICNSQKTDQRCSIKAKGFRKEACCN